MLNHKIGRYIVLLPLILALVSLAWTSSIIPALDKAQLEEKFTDTQDHIDGVCAIVDDMIRADDDWNQYDYERILRQEIERLDNKPFIFACLYDSDLNIVSTREASYAATPFLPRTYPEFMTAVRDVEFDMSDPEAVDAGSLVLSFTPSGARERDMYVYFRWVPTNDLLNDRYLAVAAVSKYSLTVNVTSTIGRNLMIQCGILFVSEIALTILMTRLGSVWRSRDIKRVGGRHRERDV
jgi:hypothetical protein